MIEVGVLRLTCSSASPSPPPQQSAGRLPRIGRLPRPSQALRSAVAPASRGNIYDVLESVASSDDEDEDEEEEEEDEEEDEDDAAAATAAPIPARIGRPRGTRAAYYRPVVSGRYYRVLTQQEFDRLREAEKRRYSHVGRIEEVAKEAEVMTSPCRRCRGDLRGGHPCRKYTRIAAWQWEGKQGRGKCGRCRWLRKPCEA